MTEYWVSQARHWCEYCRIYINGTKPSIAFHENGKKHKEIVETFLKDMRKRGRERRIEKDDTAKELAKIEREAMKQYQREDLMGFPGGGPAGPPTSEAREARLAQLEATMNLDRQQREQRLAIEATVAAALPNGWEATTNPDGKTFYTHIPTGAVQWERPQRAAAAAGADALPEGWEAATNPDGKTFYTHVPTGEVQWERPTAAGGAGSSGGAEEATGGGGWQQGWTEEGVPYYYDVAKGITQWEVPDDWVPPQQSQPREGGEGAAAVTDGAGAVDYDERQQAALTAGAEADPNTGLGAWSAVEPQGVDANTGLGVWETVETPSYAGNQVREEGDQPRWGKRPRGYGKGDSDEEEKEEMLDLLQSKYAVSEDMKAAVAKLEEDEKAAEAAAEAGAAPVFKKRKAGQGGFRKKTGI